MYAFLNGNLVKQEELKIHISDLSYQFGYGLFETIKYKNERLIFFEDHYKRLKNSSRILRMNFPAELAELKEWVLNTLAKNNLKNARVKIILSKKFDGKFNLVIMTSELDESNKSFRLICKKFDSSENHIFLRYKTTSRVDYHLAFLEVQEAGYDDALFMNIKNELSECSRSNIFLVMEDKIITPDLSSGILPGITREKIILLAKKNAIVVEEKKVSYLYLNKAKSVFVTNAIIGIQPVSEIKFEDRLFSFEISQIFEGIKSFYEDLIC